MRGKGVDSIRWGRRVAAIVLLAGIFGWAGLASSAHELVRIRDDCDPATFNEAVGPGTCEGDGGVTFSRFIAELERKGEHGAWRNNPDDTTVDAGTPIPVVNEGGEFHTLTKVAAYGGGFVEELNHLAGTPEPAPECATRNPDGSLAPQPPGAANLFLPAGGDSSLATGPATDFPTGEWQLQCCLHPWMRTDLTVR